MRCASLKWLTSGIAGCALVACGGGDKQASGPDIGGMYELTRHTRNSSGCDAEGEALDGPPFFQLTFDRFFGQPFYAVEGCDETDPDTCSWEDLSGSFYESRDGAWLGEVFFSTGGESSPCTLGLIESLATPEEGGGAVLIEMWSLTLDAPDLTGDACDPVAAEARRDELVCESYEVAHGVRIE